MCYCSPCWYSLVEFGSHARVLGPLVSYTISSCTSEFLGVKTMVVYPFGKLRASALAFPFLVLPSAPPVWLSTTSDEQVSCSCSPDSFFPLYLGVQLVLSFQNPLSGPFVLNLLWTWPCLLGRNGPQGMINVQAEFFKNSGILSTYISALSPLLALFPVKEILPWYPERCYLFIYLPCHRMQDHSTLTRDQTSSPCSESSES